MNLCKDSISTYLDAVFGYLDGWIALRAFPEVGGKTSEPPHCMWVKIDDETKDKVFNFAKWADGECAACYLIPGVVSEQGKASAADVIATQVILIDIDTADTESKLKHLVKYIGQPTLIIESGGITEEGNAKLHAYWKLSEPAEGNDLQTALLLRKQIAEKVGGDSHFASAHQPIRIAGSVYHKHGKSKLVAIRSHNETEYHLDDLKEAIENMPAMEGITVPEKPDLLDFNDKHDIENVLTTPVREGGKDDWSRFEGISRVIGYWIRRYHDGVTTHEKAWEEICSYNESCIRPPWSEKRLSEETNRIWKKHLEKHGNPQETIQEEPSFLNLKEWHAENYSGEAPKQEFLVSGTFPMGVVSILAAMGDTGKGMLTLNLALQVATFEKGLFELSPRPISFGNEVQQFGTAVIFTAEDDKNEVHRRLTRLDPGRNYLKEPERLIIIPLPNAGGTFPLIASGKEGVESTDEFELVKEQLLEISDLKLVVFDPLASFIHADVNADPAAGSFATGLLASLAAETGASVIIPHHMRKPSGGKPITTAEQARDAIRGTSALVDGVRCAYAIWSASKEHQDTVFKSLKENFRQNAVFQGGIVKSNSPADRTLRTYLRNDAGLLVDVTYELKSETLPIEELREVLVSAITKSSENGHPFTHTGGSGVFKQRNRLPEIFHNIARHKLETVVQELLNEGILVKGRASGSKEEKWLDIPAGPFAMGEGEFKEGAEVSV
nr:hypothetical protein 23 [bacterium]